MRTNVILMPTVEMQQKLGYDLVVDASTAEIPARVPVWAGRDYQRSAIGWVENVRLNEAGQIIGDMDLPAFYDVDVVVGLDWIDADGRTILWAANTFPMPPMEGSWDA